jgi:membrane-bound metal-dependent hydrolase YbcI (DUF457 family)
MSLPLAHALVGGSVAVALWPERTPAGVRRGLVVGALLGVCPDVDFLLGRLRLLSWGWHHGPTHSVAFAVVVGAAVSWALGLRGWRGVLACVLPVLSHSVLDYLVTESPGVALWWPVTGAVAFVKLCAAEILLFGPVLALAVWARRRGRGA